MQYILKKSALTLTGWVLEDTESGVLCSFKAHKFNETQEWEMIKTPEATGEELANELATAARNAADWIRENAYFVAMPITSEDFNKYIAQQVRCARLAKGWSKYKLAKETGVSERHIGYIESGEHNIGVELLYKISETLDVVISLR